MPGIPGQQAAARRTASACRVDHDEAFAFGDDVELAHVGGVFRMTAAAMQDDHNRRWLPARKVMDQKASRPPVMRQGLLA
jgi:hypothetical protein